MRATKKKLLERHRHLLGKGKISPREHVEILAIQERFAKPKLTRDELIQWYIANPILCKNV